MNLTYIASPYTHPDLTVRWERYEAAVRAVARIFNAGMFCFSPIVHCAEAAERHGLPHDWQTWAAFDRRMIAACDSLTVLCIPGWNESRGVKAEVAIARDLGMMVWFVNEDGIDVRTSGDAIEWLAANGWTA